MIWPENSPAAPYGAADVMESRHLGSPPVAKTSLPNDDLKSFGLRRQDDITIDDFDRLHPIRLVDNRHSRPGWNRKVRGQGMRPGRRGADAVICGNLYVHRRRKARGLT